MFCKKCGAKLEDNATFCAYCGEKNESIKENVNENITNNEVNTIPTQPQDINVNNNTNYTTANATNNSANTSNSNNNGGLKAIIAILILIIVAAGGFLAVKYISDKNIKTPPTKNPDKELPPVEEEPPVEVVDEKGNIVTLNNFKFNIPEEYIYSLKDDYIEVKKKDGSFMINFGIENYGIENFISSKEEIKQIFIEDNYNATNISVETHGTREYLVYDLMKDDIKAKYIFTKLDDYNTLYGMFADINNDNEKGYTLINKLIEDSQTVSASVLNAAPFKFNINKNILK